jgi:hypothetical protein
MPFWKYSLACTISLLALCSCGSDEATPGTFVGRAGRYDYSPSVIRTGNQVQIWWCGMAKNPQKADQDTDAILYQTIDTQTRKKSSRVVVLAETPGTWDQVFTCNPRVIRGSFVDPLGDGTTYTYAMYYVATASGAGLQNNIGVAFSNDGIHWNKYKNPVISASGPTDYGVGQPALYNLDGKSQMVMFYEDTGATIEHKEATTNDGVHFTDVGTLTRNGLDPNNPSLSWGDMAYDPKTHFWYAAFDSPLRSAASTGGEQEHGQYGIQLYRIPDGSLLSGTEPWQLLATFDTNTTGFESNFLAGFEKDQYGSLDVGAYPKIQMYPSIATPPPRWDDDAKTAWEDSDLVHWDIGSFVWDPSATRLTLTLYQHGADYETTSGYVDPSGGLKVSAAIGHLLPAPQGGATIAFYNCKSGKKDYFVSTDAACGGAYVVGLEGYGYPPRASAAEAAGGSVAMYSCPSSGGAHFVSKDPACRGGSPGTLLGYALP